MGGGEDGTWGLDPWGSEGDSEIGGKEVVRAMDMRVLSTRERDIRGCGFLMGEGVAAARESTIWVARASSAVSSGG